MSFLDNIEKLASDYLSGASPQEAADAASDHVLNMDSNDPADHLGQSLPTMDPSSIAGLGKQLLAAFTNHPSSTVDADTATQEAGTSPEAVASGEPGAVGALVDYAKAHPEVLQSAAGAFMQHNPGAIAQLAPGLLQGIMSRFGGAAS